jgi:DNA polymerase theta
VAAKSDLSQANSLVNAAIEDCSISKLRAVVLDELHMIDDGYRGYLLELMATKLLCLGQPVQIIGMSATLTVGPRPAIAATPSP